MAVQRVHPVLSLVLVSLSLSACGGDEAKSHMSLSLSSENLSLEDDSSSPEVRRERIWGRITPLDQMVYVGVLCSSEGLDHCAFDISTYPFTVDAMFKSPLTLPAGTYDDQIIVAVCEDDVCTKHISGSPQVVNVHYTVHNWLKATPGTLSLTSPLGSDVQPHLNLSIDALYKVSWKAEADQPWIKLPPSPEGSSSAGGSSSLSVGVDPGGLELGLHEGLITLTNVVTRDSTQVPVKLEVVKASLSTQPRALAFGGADGADLSTQQLALSLNTGGTAYSWTATVDTGDDPPWLKLSRTSGTASSAPTALTASVNATGLRSGTHSASVTFTAQVAGQTVSQTVPVSLLLAPHTLWAPDNGVALVSTPSLSKLSQTVALKDSRGLPTTPWTASSNQPWLSVTASGTSGDPLTLTANPTGLDTDTVHFATVTLGTSDSTVEGSETIQVGLWVGASSPNNQDTVNVSAEELVVDPIRPYVYVHDRYSLSVYNVYTAALVTRLTNLSSTLGQMDVSSDGSALYVLDRTNHRVLPIDLRTLTVGSPWNTGSWDLNSIIYVRPNGHGLVLINRGLPYEPSTGAAVSHVTGGNQANGSYVVDLFSSASLDGSLLCHQLSRSAQDYKTCWGLRYSSLNGGTATYVGRGSLFSPNFIVAISHDGSRVYTVGSPRIGSSTSAITVFDGQTMDELSALPIGAAEGLALEIGPEGWFYIGVYASGPQDDVLIYDSAGTSRGSYRVAPTSKIISPRKLKLSGDGKRIVAITNVPSSGNFPSLNFVTVP